MPRAAAGDADLSVNQESTVPVESWIACDDDEERIRGS
jgi:hypothetical protein